MVEGTILAALRKYLSVLQTTGIHAHRAILFGSFARGEAHEYSDIDLIVIAPELDPPRERNLDGTVCGLELLNANEQLAGGREKALAIVNETSGESWKVKLAS